MSGQEATMPTVHHRVALVQLFLNRSVMSMVPTISALIPKTAARLPQYQARTTTMMTEQATRSKSKTEQNWGRGGGYRYQLGGNQAQEDHAQLQAENEGLLDEDQSGRRSEDEESEISFVSEHIIDEEGEDASERTAEKLSIATRGPPWLFRSATRRRLTRPHGSRGRSPT